MKAPSLRQSGGLSYLEVMVASVVLALAAVPALDAMTGGGAASTAQATQLDAHYAHVATMETLLTIDYATLLAAAEAAGDSTTPTALGTPGVEVFVARWDGAGNPFSVSDPDLDRDGNPFTGYVGMLWVRAARQASAGGLEALVAP